MSRHLSTVAHVPGADSKKVRTKENRNINWIHHCLLHIGCYHSNILDSGYFMIPFPFKKTLQFNPKNPMRPMKNQKSRPGIDGFMEK